jgi:hypothetical protein
MQIKNALRFHLLLIRMAIFKCKTTTNGGEDVLKQESLYTVSGYANLYIYYGKKYGDSSKS